MNRPIATTLALLGCSDYGFGDEVPEWPNPAVPPVQNVDQTDVIVQVTTPQVDILWMIDNSCSMADEQNDLSENFPLFMDFFVGSGLDYNVGVTSSDLDGNYNGSKGKLRDVAGARYLTPDTLNPIEVFEAMATMGTMGSGTEKGIGAVYMALETNRDTTNFGFYRDDAALHTVIISDEPDLTPQNDIDINEFIDWYDGLKAENDDRTFSAVIDMNLGSRYKTAAIEIGGIIWSLLDENWPQVLEELGIQASGLKREYFLSQRPVLGTISVTVVEESGAELRFEEGIIDELTGDYTDQDGDGLPDGDWAYNSTRNSISFREFIPKALSSIQISYTLLSSEQQVEETPE